MYESDIRQISEIYASDMRHQEENGKCKVYQDEYELWSENVKGISGKVRVMCAGKSEVYSKDMYEKSTTTQVAADSNIQQQADSRRSQQKYERDVRQISEMYDSDLSSVRNYLDNLTR